MLKIGITGGIGSGKSVVTNLFRKLGVPVFDSDLVARSLIDSDPVIKAQIIEAFGRDAYLPENQGLNRKKIGGLVFNNQQLLETLNKITHPPVIKAAEDWVAIQNEAFKSKMSEWSTGQSGTQNSAIADLDQAKPTSYLIKEAALLFESGSNRSLDFILGIYADKATRIQRIMDRDQLSFEAANSRILKQMDENEKMKRCGGVIVNNGQTLLWPQVIAWHRQFLQQSSKAAVEV